jgi:hypothetical protein
MKGSSCLSRNASSMVRFFTVIFVQVLGRGGPERAQFARAIEFGFAKLDQPLREILLGLPAVARSSALANACSSELLVDVPDPAARSEAAARSEFRLKTEEDCASPFGVLGYM